MQYVRVKNLEKYHPGYTDRALLWAKIHFTMLNGDPDFEMLHEIDKWRFVSFMIIELQSKKPIPIDPNFLMRKGFDLEIRPISLTLKMLHNFLLVVTEEEEVPCIEKRREEKRREEKDPPLAASYPQEVVDKSNKALELGFNVYQQLAIYNKGKINRVPDDVVLSILDEFFDKRETIKDIFPYMGKVIQEKSRRYWSSFNASENDKLKKDSGAVGDVLRQLACTQT